MGYRNWDCELRGSAPIGIMGLEEFKTIQKDTHRFSTHHSVIPTFHPSISEAKIGSRKNALSSIGYVNSETFSYIL